MSAKSNTLFHFTSEMDTIMSILEKGFIPMYCEEQLSDLFGSEEELYGSGIERYIGLNTFPMVCFCDIPLTRTDEHIKHYGNFAIGMSQSWALKNGLTPVMYYSKEMPIYSSIKDLLNKANSGIYREDFSLDNNENTLDAYYESLGFIRIMKSYLKPMKVPSKDKSTKLKYIYFHIENEWRFVPDKSKYEKLTQKPFYIRSNRKNTLNNIKLKSSNNMSLKVNIEDIEYIIVKDVQDIPVLVNRIREWSRKYSDSSVDMLLTKIISSYHIKSDF